MSGDAKIPDFKIAAAQVRSVCGNIDANIAAHAAAIAAAASHEVSVVVFPELSLTGYEPGLAAELALTPTDECLAPLAAAAHQHQMDVVLGAPLRNAGMKPGLGAILFAADGSIRSYAKMQAARLRRCLGPLPSAGPRRSLDQTLVKPSRNRREEAPVLFEPRDNLTKPEDLSTLTVRKTGAISPWLDIPISDYEGHMGLPSVGKAPDQPAVSLSPFCSLGNLHQVFSFVNVDVLRELLAAQGFAAMEETRINLPSGKSFYKLVAKLG